MGYTKPETLRAWFERHPGYHKAWLMNNAEAREKRIAYWRAYRQSIKDDPVKLAKVRAQQKLRNSNRKRAARLGEHDTKADSVHDSSLCADNKQA